MGRHKRTYAPGMVLHLTSRTRGKAPLFVPELRSAIARLIPRMVERTDARLLAYAVMPNHFHILLRQGRAELKAVMQPLLRRVAHRVQTRHGLEGGVVERPYRDQLCESDEHLRHALVYVHLNPWRAGLCGDDLSYPWTTHAAYLPDSTAGLLGIAPDEQQRALEAFATGDAQSRNLLCGEYMRWVERRMEQDRARAGAGAEASLRAALPTTPGATRHPWRSRLQPTFRYPPEGQPDLRPDLRDFVFAQTATLEPGCPLEALRGSWLPRPRARVRARLIRAAAMRGYRTTEIARFFDLSPAAVSRARYAPPQVDNA